MFYSLFVKAVPPSFGGRSLVFPSCCRDLFDFRGCVGVVFRLLHPSPTCNSQKQGNQKKEYCSDFKQPSTWDSSPLVSCRSRPNHKFEKFHILILLLSKPSLNPFIVIFLWQFIGGRAWEIHWLKLIGLKKRISEYEKDKRSRGGDFKLRANEPLESSFNACASIKQLPKAFCSQV